MALTPLNGEGNSFKESEHEKALFDRCRLMRPSVNIIHDASSLTGLQWWLMFAKSCHAVPSSLDREYDRGYESYDGLPFYLIVNFIQTDAH